MKDVVAFLYAASFGLVGKKVRLFDYHGGVFHVSNEAEACTKPYLGNYDVVEGSSKESEEPVQGVQLSTE